MDIKNYIESGIIENFVLGIASQEESAILQCVMANSSEVRSAVLEAQETFEKVAFTYSVPAPSELKRKISNQLNFKKQEAVNETVIIAPESTTSEIRPVNSGQERTISSAGKWLAAASILLLMGLGYSVFQNKEMQNEIAASKKQNIEIQDQNKLLASQNQLILNSKKVNLKGQGKHLDANANIFWDESKIVYLSAEKLPKAPQGKQYQLWAIVDGKPVDIGMYTEGAAKLQEMKVVPNAQAFAITLEKEGGSDTPTMEEMYVMGEV